MKMNWVKLSTATYKELFTAIRFITHDLKHSTVNLNDHNHRLVPIMNLVQMAELYVALGYPASTQIPVQDFSDLNVLNRYNIWMYNCLWFYHITITML